MRAAEAMPERSAAEAAELLRPWQQLRAAPEAMPECIAAEAAELLRPWQQVGGGGRGGKQVP